MPFPFAGGLGGLPELFPFFFLNASFCIYDPGDSGSRLGFVGWFGLGARMPWWSVVLCWEIYLKIGTLDFLCVS